MSKRESKEFRTVAKSHIGTRLDIFCANEFGITRSKAQKLISDELLLVNRKKANSKYIVGVGDKVSLIFPNENKKIPKVPVIYEDEEVLVVNKPSGISVHPSTGDKDITLTEMFSDKIDDPKGLDRPGVVHRLDKGTSGVVVLAKTSGARENLQKQFKTRQVGKQYIALVEGKIEPASGVIDIPISRNLRNRNKMTASLSGKSARTEYRVINYIDGYSYVEAKIFTGRTHQIRVHLSSIGYPVVGDLKYGKNSDFVDRIFLHSERLEFTHPRTGRIMSFRAELPEELMEAINKIKSL